MRGAEVGKSTGRGEFFEFVFVEFRDTDGQVVNEKRQRDLVELVRYKLIGELAGKRHQVVGRD